MRIIMSDINIALLIDSDNISAKYIAVILSELSKYGKVTIRRMYGDWTQDRLHSWMRCSSTFSLTPIMQPNNTPGKNASDIGLIIDAMDILYTGDVQGFCIVSSDGDFNKLATRLREAGKIVIGMGEKKTPESFRASCERFIFLDVVDSSDDDESDSPPVTSRGRSRSAAYGANSGTGAYAAVSNANGTGGAASGTAGSSSASPVSSARRGRTTYATALAPSTRRRQAASLADPSPVYDSDAMGLTPASAGADPSETNDTFTDKATIESAIVKIITDNNTEGKETGLGEIGSRLVKIFPDFDIRNYHYSKLSEYLMDFSSLKLENRDGAMWVTLNSSPDSEVEQQIRSIFEKHKTEDLYIHLLKKELEALNPNLEATIRRSGVTRFSVYLNRKIASVEVNGRHVLLRK